MKILKKSVGKELEIVNTEEKYLMDCAREHFGKEVTMERVYLGGFEFILVVDEDGLSKQLPLNFIMDFSSMEKVFPVQPIVGDAIFVRCKPCNPYEEELWDFEVTDVTEEDFERLRQMLTFDSQSRLFQRFVTLSIRRLYGEK